MANNAERHEQLMQQMANLTASLGGLTNLNPLLAQQQQTNAELSSLSTHLGGVAARIDALVAAGGVPPPSGVAGTAAAGGVTPTVPDGADYPSKPNPPDHSDLLRYEKRKRRVATLFPCVLCALALLCNAVSVGRSFWRILVMSPE